MPSALITGANRGLGLEFARQYLADGWQVYAASRDPASASELRHLAEGSDDKLRILAMDVTDPASIHAAAIQLDGQAIDLLLNNAGIIGPRGQTIGNIEAVDKKRRRTLEPKRNTVLPRLSTASRQGEVIATMAAVPRNLFGFLLHRALGLNFDPDLGLPSWRCDLKGVSLRVRLIECFSHGPR